MKKLFLTAMLLAAVPSFAGDVRISARSTLGALNKSAHTVYFTIQVSNPSTEPSCSGNTSSTVIALQPGASITFSDNNLPPGIEAGSGSGSHYYYLSAVLYDGPDGCSSNAVVVGEPCTAAPLVAATEVKNTDCTTAGTVSATWSIGSDATVLTIE